ncbi:MAG TPA: hypothetical protein VGH37_17865 [Candidatus Acidoferrum sp.]
MARTRTTKVLAQRIDLNYFKRPTPYKRAKLALSVLVPLLALGWIGWRGFSRDSRVYSSGRMSEAHAVLEKQCAVCHLKKERAFSSKAVDSACLGCHDGPVHHENQIKAEVPECADCHVEHRGRVNIRAASNESCTECHGNLKAGDGAVHYATNIRSLGDGHPEFAALRQGAKDPGTILLNHATHLKPIRRGPNGPIVQLECGDCHRTAATNAPWTYGDAQFATATVSYKDEKEFLPVRAQGLPRRRGLDGREYMAPVKFGTACAGCHSLAFDKRIDEQVPHDKPEIVHAFVVKKLQEYIATHPSEVRVLRDPSRDLTGKPLRPKVRVLTASQSVAERTDDAEKLLWRKTCKQCHVLENSTGSALPRIAAGRITQRWLPHAKFDHDAHRGFSCVSCHVKAVSSKESSDVLIPGIANCQACHAPGPAHAESRCFECHTYHDWSKRKEVRPTYVMPGLQTGGK